MKKKFLFVLPMLATLVATQISIAPQQDVLPNAGPAPVEFSNDTKGQYIGSKKAAEGDARPTSLTVHYQTDDPTKKLEDLCFYFWTESKDGEEIEPTSIEDGWMSVTVNPREDYGEHNKFMLIIKKRGTWAGQSTDTEVPYDKFPAKEDGTLEIWLIDGEGGNIEVCSTYEQTQGGKIAYARFADDWKTIKVKADDEHTITNWQLYGYTSEYYSYPFEFRDKYRENYKIGEGEATGQEISIKLPYYAPSALSYLVKVTFNSGKSKQRLVAMESLYETERFKQYYEYDGNDLGAVYSKEKTSFKLWAPMCSRVTLRVYNAGTPQFLSASLGDDFYEEYLMSYNKGGVWSAEIEGDLNGKYYTYNVCNFGGENEVCDPYAKASGINGIRAMVLDFDTTDPEGWDTVPTKWDGVEGYDIKDPTDLTVYETHIRDLTMHDTWQSSKDPATKKGTFDAFAETGTTYTDPSGEHTVKTGHDHITELGVNAVQILPFFDHANSEVDKDPTDGKLTSSYNWGYNPQNYNVVEGMYSKDPHHGEVRVMELKNLVKSFADDANHTRIIMDVVYNHVGSVNSVNFNKIMPKYYFRVYTEAQHAENEHKLPGYYADGAGCGNEVKSEATMMKKFIVESVAWWASEYKIKGFRFDLMKLIDSDTMRLVKDAVHAIDPDNVCWGEGWALDYNGIPGNDTESWVVFNKLGQTTESPGHLGAFSDRFRDGIRGGNDQGFGSEDHHPTKGFIAQNNGEIKGDKYKLEGFTEGMLGIFKEKGSRSQQTVNYASCHDNYTLFDQLTWTLGDQKTQAPAFKDVADALLAVQSAVTFSSGISFYNGGEELFRSKEEPENADELLKPGEIKYYCDFYGKNVSHNSYKSTDEVNAYDYSRKISAEYYGETFDTTKLYAKYVEMIHARSSYNGRISNDNNANTPAGDKANEKEVGCNIWNSLDTYNNSTTIAVYIKNHNDQYYLFLGGSQGGDIGFGDYDNCDIIFNSKGEGDYDVFKSSDQKGIYLKPRTFVVMKKR